VGESDRVTVLVPLAQLLAVAYCFALPGLLVAAQLDEEWSWLVRGALGFGLGALVVPTASFGAAWLLGTSVGPWLVIGVATLFNAAGAAVWWLRSRRGAR